MNNRTPSAYSIPAARKVSVLRQRMIDDMTVRNLAPNTMLGYLKQVNYGRSPTSSKFSHPPAFTKMPSSAKTQYRYISITKKFATICSST
jgi:hypothetical protein